LELGELFPVGHYSQRSNTLGAIFEHHVERRCFGDWNYESVAQTMPAIEGALAKHYLAATKLVLVVEPSADQQLVAGQLEEAAVEELWG
jgi:glutamine phosphoribosylpyrophosphate amidotransferase